MPEIEKLTSFIPEKMKGERLDKTLARLYPSYSRSEIQKWLKQARVLVDDEILSQKYRVNGGEYIEIELKIEEKLSSKAQNIPLDIIYQDQDLLVLNKPAGLIVHPGAGNPDSTLMNGLLYYDPRLKQLPRAGIVHRLDKDTSGLMMVACNENARLRLIELLQARDVSRKYQCITHGVPISGAKVSTLIARHRIDRRRMCVSVQGKEAITQYRVIKKFLKYALLEVRLETGRTHQIRVHMHHQGYPLVGDPMYGASRRFVNHPGEKLNSALIHFKRQALHAFSLAFVHPATGQAMEFSCPLADDIQALIDILDNATDD